MSMHSCLKIATKQDAKRWLGWASPVAMLPHDRCRRNLCCKLRPPLNHRCSTATPNIAWKLHGWVALYFRVSIAWTNAYSTVGGSHLAGLPAHMNETSRAVSLVSRPENSQHSSRLSFGSRACAVPFERQLTRHFRAACRAIDYRSQHERRCREQYQRQYVQLPRHHATFQSWSCDTFPQTPPWQFEPVHMSFDSFWYELSVNHHYVCKLHHMVHGW